MDGHASTANRESSTLPISSCALSVPQDSSFNAFPAGHSLWRRCSRVDIVYITCSGGVFPLLGPRGLISLTTSEAATLKALVHHFRLPQASTPTLKHGLVWCACTSILCLSNLLASSRLQNMAFNIAFSCFLVFHIELSSFLPRPPRGSVLWWCPVG